MDIKEIKEAYINKDENASHKAKVWSKVYIFGENVNGESFWSIGISYVSELLNLLGNKKIYDKINVDDITQIIDNENYIQELLKETDKSEYIKLKEILTLNNSVKKMLYDYIKNKISKNFPKQMEKNSNDSNIIYHELSNNSFHIDTDRNYIANNVLFNNFKINKITITGDINKGLITLQNFIKNYKDKDLKKMCVEALMIDDFISDWDDNATSYDGCYNLFTNKVLNININDTEIEIWFGTVEDAFGGHTPVMYLSIDKAKKSAELVG